MYSEKSINLFVVKKDKSPNYLLNNYFLITFRNYNANYYLRGARKKGPLEKKSAWKKVPGNKIPRKKVPEKTFSVKDALRIHSQPRVQYDQNFSTPRYNKNLKKIILKKSKTYIFYNNNAKKLLRNYQKKYLPSK